MQDTASQLGAAHLAAGRFQEAARAFEEAVHACPTEVAAWHDLGLARYKARDIDGARTAFERALALIPDHVHSLLNLARTELDVGEVDRARELCLQVPGEPAALVLLGHVHEVSGQRAAAVDAFRSALEVQPGFVGAWCGLARLDAVEDPGALAELLDRGQLSRPDEAALRMALARTYDRLGEPDRAFGEAARGNALRRSSFDAETYSRLIDATLAAPLPAVDSGHPATPVFIVGAPRSGSSLLERVLARHPRLHGYGERPEVGRALQQLGFPSGLDGLDATGLHGLAEAYLDALGPLPPGVTHPIDKAPSNLLGVGLLARMFPRATFLHATRDPRDVAISTFLIDFGDHRLGQGTSLGDMARFLADVERLAAHWSATVPRFHAVSHEELLDDLEGVARRVLGALELPWEPACLSFHEAQTPCMTASSQQVREPLNRRGAGRWQSYSRYLAALGGGPPQGPG